MKAALSGELDGTEYRTDELFGFDVPVAVPGVDSSLLDPASTWADRAAYGREARELARMFRDNFKQFADDAGEAVGGRRASRLRARFGCSSRLGHGQMMPARTRG